MKSAQTDQEIAEFFDRCAQRGSMQDFPPPERTKLDSFLALWAIPPGSRALEPGCGSGRLTTELAKAVGSQGEVYACDLSGEMLRAARERDLPAQAHFEQESILDASCRDGWFDYIICLNVFPHFAQPEETLRKFARILKPNGQLWINHFEGSDNLNRYHREAAAEVSDHVFPCRHTMERLLTGAGFRIERLEDCTEHYILQAKLQSGF